MKFNQKVEDQFRKAGWFPGRDVSDKFSHIHRLDELPVFLKQFLYEYGDLEVETLTLNAKGMLNLKVLPDGFFKLNSSLDNPKYYGNIFTFPFGDYHLDSAILECDAEGRIYMVSDFPTLMSNNFIEGIEKAIMEDYSNTLEWNPETKEWVNEY